MPLKVDCIIYNDHQKMHLKQLVNKLNKHCEYQLQSDFEIKEGKLYCNQMFCRADDMKWRGSTTYLCDTYKDIIELYQSKYEDAQAVAELRNDIRDIKVTLHNIYELLKAR